MEPSEIWKLVFEIVRKELAVPTVWLAMQAVTPLTIEGNYFVAALPPQDKYLSANLQDDKASTAIEDALRTVTGRILAFRLIVGMSLSDWEAEKSRETGGAGDGTPEPAPGHVVMGKAAAPASPTPPPAGESTREVSPTWEKLSERLMHGYKTAPFTKYPHGQALYVLTSVKIVSDTIDALMPPPGAPRDDAAERALAKVIERLGSVVNLDPMFLSLELFRYRASMGKNHDIPL